MPYFESGGGTKWNYLNSKTGSTEILLPGSFNELLVIVDVNNQDMMELTLNIPEAYLTTTDKSFRSGYYSASNSFAVGIVKVNKSALSLNYANITGAVVTNNSTITVYYR